MDMNSGYRIESGTGLAGVTEIDTFYDFVNLLVIDYWNLGLICDLVLGIWDFRSWRGKQWMLF